jgi:hypothetical protein
LPKKRLNIGRLVLGLLLGTLLGLIIGVAAICILDRNIFVSIGALIHPFDPKSLEGDDLSLLRKELFELQGRYYVGRGNCVILPVESKKEKDFSFVNGCFSTKDGEFYEALTGVSTSFAFCHDESKDFSEFLILSGSKDKPSSCRAGVEASFDGENAVFKSVGPLQCNTDSYPPLVVSCAPGDPLGTEAKCSLLEASPDGTFYVPVPLTLRKEFLW